MQSLEAQTFRNFEIIAVDNSGRGLVRHCGTAANLKIIENPTNVGYGAAVNQAARQSRAPFLAVLNDDAEAHPEWLSALVEVMEADAGIGLCASQVRLAGEAGLDSAGMLIAADGSSKQRGHGEHPASYKVREEVLFPSGSAALYRREMFDQIGGFDEEFFLYCEDTDLGLRARRNGWTCLYVPEAIVEHHYSHSAGRASGLKAFYVERNRLFVVIKNFPMRLLWRAPLVTIARYVWHAVDLFGGKGKASHFRKAGNSSLMLGVFVLRAHIALIVAFPRLLQQRRAIRRGSKLQAAEFSKLLRRHSISARQVAAL
jgi:GT2 family glycosyltransferase